MRCSITLRIRRIGVLLAAFAAILCLSWLPAGSQSNNQTSPLGMNLAGVNYWTSEQPFLNIFKTGNGWITDNRGDTSEESLLQLDSNGWVTSFSGVHSYTNVQQLFLRDLPAPYYPAGQYIVLYDGQGTIKYSFDAVKNTKLSTLGRDVLDIATPSSAGILIYITATDPNNTGNYIRNIRLVYAPNESFLAGGEIFNPAFLSEVSPFRTFRFMDWMKTNNSTQSSWGSRLLPSHGYYGVGGGVPVEVMVALANQQSADAWFNMPHMGTDDYITQFATLVHQQLGSSQKVYVEYSNETWNYMFGQTAWIQNKGLQTWPSTDYFTANRNFYGMRAAQICDIWKSVWGADAGRVVCVMGAQAAATYTATASLTCSLWSSAPCASHGINAVAIAPYFGGYNVPDSWTTQPDGGRTSLFTEITQGGLAPGGYPGGMIKQAIDWVASYQTVANSYGIDLIAYEGGQHLLNSSDAALTTLYIAANRDWRMGTAYSTYLQGWKNMGGHLFIHFSNVASYSKWGSFGALENIMHTSSPKYSALTDFIAANPCWWNGCIATSTSTQPADTTPPTVPHKPHRSRSL
jgi:hypothetical protein